MKHFSSDLYDSVKDADFATVMENHKPVGYLHSYIDYIYVLVVSWKIHYKSRVFVAILVSRSLTRLYPCD